jgi:hypothetical protein
MGDTGVVIYGNGVIGARSNFEGGARRATAPQVDDARTSSRYTPLMS